MKVTVVGTGYVGLVTGVCLAEVGHAVTCVDLDQEKVRKLTAGVPPIYEPGLEGLLKRNVEDGRISFTTDLGAALAGAECLFIAVGTPQGEDGSADLSHVMKVADDVGRLLKGDLIVIVKSTVPVGTCDQVEARLRTILQSRGVGHKVSVASNPEFLKEGVAIEDFMKPDRIVVGVLEGDGLEPAFRELYRPFIIDDPAKLMLMNRRSSEMTKYGANAMLATRISFMNELARLAEAAGANIDDIRRGMGSDPRIGRKFLYAGPGYGGSCFPKDVSALLRTGRALGLEMKVLQAVTAANEDQKNWVSDKVCRHLGTGRGKRCAVWGLAFKPGTDDVRESPSRTIIARLLEAGAEVVAHDPVGMANFQREFGPHPRLSYASSAIETVKGADALILVTEWSEYRRPNWEKIGPLMRTRAAFDFRNQWHGASMRHLGFHYECVGRPLT